MKTKNTRRRVKLLNKRRFITVVCTFVFIIMASVSVISSAASFDSPIEYRSFIVSRGDTLWSIAREFTPKNMDLREYINEIEKANVIHNSFLAEGQELKLPVLN